MYMNMYNVCFKNILQRYLFMGVGFKKYQINILKFDYIFRKIIIVENHF